MKTPNRKQNLKIVSIVAMAMPALSYAGGVSEVIEDVARVGVTTSGHLALAHSDSDNSGMWWVILGIALIIGIIASMVAGSKKG